MKRIYLCESIDTLTECELLERASRCLGKYEVDEHDLEGIPYTVANVIQHPSVRGHNAQLT